MPVSNSNIVLWYEQSDNLSANDSELNSTHPTHTAAHTETEYDFPIEVGGKWCSRN